MKLFLSTPIEGSPTGSVAARVSDYLRHKLHFSERFDEDDPESRLEFYAREAMTYLAIVQWLLAEHPELSDEVCSSEGEIRLDIEHGDAEAIRALLELAPKRKQAAEEPRPKVRTTRRKAGSSRASKPSRRTELSAAGREVMARVGRQRWARYRKAQQAKGRKASGS